MEETHYLIENELKIIQNDKYFKFGTDSVLLANFAEFRPGDKVVDLGTGSGVIPLLLAYKNSGIKVSGVEIQSPLVELARRNVEINNLKERVNIIEADLCSLEDVFAAGSADAVISNPPYLPVQSGETKENKFIAAARHEIHADIKDVIKAASRVIKFGGNFYLVYRSWRLTEVIELLSRYNFQAKKMRFVHSRPQKESDIFLMKAKKGASPGLRVDPALFIYKEKSNLYTDEVKEIYGEDC
ncbi:MULTISPECIES: tRNA1(Val) (adenine(37)-N6)-methyltransferase [unclassified Halanaerobium]|uniref:tRNA1(Val) (adenine(37)-N6)-methyltransferase n=1 Tax=unclassified Halanaerobium TaxID=2641197 RepID=UPI000DF3CC0B|nr:MULTISPECIES: tRNA1(Val) (adenine(37)-N6)-methyltransferase [unclassified Halanaerobium]RCW50712.1 tRNA1(Val) A37 N6-methylase TrmN6 [Halanaerobium sp. MA284_MarDTE_T2]RCW86880.1 tRNA1(Val) A37 N6-methylase TrmN6 [Halanaerobium sp. DL-01]